MFKKILARFGIGSARIETVLSEREVERGKEIKGEIHIFGGELKQKISKINIYIDSNFHKDDDISTQFRDITASVVDFTLTDIGTVQPNEVKKVPFSFFLPYYMPITFRDQKVKIRTKMSHRATVNAPVDIQEFVVTDPWLDEILNNLTSLGYTHTHKSGECRHRKRADENPTLFLQTFILENEDGVEIRFVGNEKDIHMYINDEDHVRHYPIYRDKDLKEQLKSLEPFLVGTVRSNS